jgi:hypothetical protein
VPASPLPEGTPLTEEEIAWFNAHFFTAEWAETCDSASSKFFKFVNIRNQFFQFFSQNLKVGVFDFIAFKSRRSQIPAGFFVGFQYGIFKESGHCIIHRPAHTKDFYQPIHVFKHMYGFRELKGIQVNKFRHIGIGREYIHIVPVSEHILVFSFCRLYNKEWDSILM